MFKPHISICKNCSKKRLLVVKAGLCEICNHLKKQNKKEHTVKKLQGKEKKVAFSSLKKKFRTPSGELSLFKKIWEERIPFSELSGKPILEFDIRCFAHLLSKKSYPSLRLDPNNVLLVTAEEHIAQHNGTLENNLKKKFYELAQLVKQAYYAKKNNL